jgi:N-acetylgalactosamine-6-sulfatase
MMGIKAEGAAVCDRQLSSRIVLLVGLLFTLAMSGRAMIEEERPNIILLLVDDMGWDIAALGHPHLKTPNLDRLVAEGRVFEHYYVASPVCSPTRVSFMTGELPSRFGIHDFISSNLRVNMRRNMPNFLDPDVMTVADVARRAGYRTGHFGKWHLSRGSNAPTLDQYGLDEFRTAWTLNYNYWYSSAHKHVDAAIGFLDGVGEQPFYLNLWFFQMHTPVVASEAQKLVYEGETFPVEDFDSYMEDYAAALPDPHAQFLLYNAAMTSVDAAVGKLLDYLDQTGLADNTLLLLTSDNGPEDYRGDISASPGAGSTGRFRGRKRSLYEGGIRMPCIVRWPGVIPAGTVDQSSVMSSVDWLPTVASLVGEEAPPFVDGEDKLEVLKGTPAERSSPLFWDFRSKTTGALYDAPRFAVRDGHWKYLWEEGLAEPELYNVLTDPEERNNLATVEVDVAGLLKEKLDTFRAALVTRIPEIISQPPGEEVVGQEGTVVWRVEATATPPPGYQWYRDGVPLVDGPKVEGASTHLLELRDLELGDSGQYVCRVKNSAGSVESSAVELAVHVTPPCPHLDKNLRDLLNYARINHPALYRQAFKLRRTGFTQGATRNWLENAICTTEGF